MICVSFPLMIISETLFYEARHVKHAMSFSHELVKFNIETDISTFRGIAVTQNGSVTLQLKVFTVFSLKPTFQRIFQGIFLFDNALIIKRNCFDLTNPHRITLA